MWYGNISYNNCILSVHFIFFFPFVPCIINNKYRTMNMLNKIKRCRSLVTLKVPDTKQQFAKIQMMFYLNLARCFKTKPHTCKTANICLSWMYAQRVYYCSNMNHMHSFVYQKMYQNSLLHLLAGRKTRYKLNALLRYISLCKKTRIQIHTLDIKKPQNSYE